MLKLVGVVVWTVVFFFGCLVAAVADQRVREPSESRADELLAVTQSVESVDAVQLRSNQRLVLFDRDLNILRDLGSTLGIPDDEIVWLADDTSEFGVITASDPNSFIIASQCWERTFCDKLVVIDGRIPVSAFIGERWNRIVVWPFLTATAIALMATAWLAHIFRYVPDYRAALDDIGAGNVERRTPKMPGDGHVVGLATSVDAALEALRSELDDNERRMADVAHDLRSALTAVRGAVELESMERYDADFDDVMVEIDRAGQLLEDVLLVGETRPVSSRLELVDIDDVLEYHLRFLQKERPELHIDADIQPVQARVAGKAMNRIVKNLLDNAAKYGDGAVRVTLQADDDMLVLRVDDDGPGIPVDQHGRVLQPFERTTDWSVEGAGLGLAISTELIDAHGGALTLTRSPLGGCQVRVTLPTNLGAEQCPALAAADAGPSRMPMVMVVLAGFFLAAAATVVALELWGRDGTGSSEFVPDESRIPPGTDLDAIGPAGPDNAVTNEIAPPPEIERDTAGSDLAEEPAGSGDGTLEVEPVNLVRDGSFESSGVPDAGFGYASSDVWLPRGGSLELWRTGYQGVVSPHGNQHTELNVDEAGSISQIIDVEPGFRYQWSLQHRGRDDLNTMELRISGEAPVLLEAEPGRWTRHAGTFTTGGDTAAVRFELESREQGQHGNFIDNIKVIAIGPEVEG